MRYIKRTLSKVNRMSPSAKASFWFVISNVVMKGISFITTPIFTRMLEVVDYGTTSVFITWEGIISIFATLNLAGGVYNVAMTKCQDDIDGYTSSMFVLESLISVLVYSLVIAFNTLFPAVFKLSFLFLTFMWLQTLTNAFTSFWLMRLRFEYKYKPVIVFTFFKAFLSPTIAIISIRLFPQNMAMAKVIGAGVFGIIFGLAIMILVLHRGKRFVSWNYWKYALRFNIPLLPHYLSSTLLNGADRLMIDGMISRAASGTYSISHSISGTLGLVTNAISSIMIPVTLQSIQKQDFQGLRKKIVSYMLIIAAICVCIMMFSKEAVLIIASSKYLDSIPYVPPLILAGYFTFASGIVGNIQFYHEKTWEMSFSTIVSAVANIGLNYFGIKRFGAIAAGYTTLITSILMFSLYCLFAWKNEKNLKSILDVPKLLVIFLGLVLYAVVAIVFENMLPVRLAFSLIPIILVIVKRNQIQELLAKSDLSDGKK